MKKAGTLTGIRVSTAAEDNAGDDEDHQQDDDDNDEDYEPIERRPSQIVVLCAIARRPQRTGQQ